jgi:hypothetical protein
MDPETLREQARERMKAHRQSPIYLAKKLVRESLEAIQRLDPEPEDLDVHMARIEMFAIMVGLGPDPTYSEVAEAVGWKGYGFTITPSAPIQ